MSRVYDVFIEVYFTERMEARKWAWHIHEHMQSERGYLCQPAWKGNCEGWESQEPEEVEGCSPLDVHVVLFPMRVTLSGGRTEEEEHAELKAALRDKFAVSTMTSRWVCRDVTEWDAEFTT